jgi:alpha-L-fucosidase
MNRRAFLQRGGAGLAALAADPSTALRAGTRWLQAARPRPTAAQLAWQRHELALFLHFGVNTFTDREWGDGREDPAIFAPAGLDARAWAKTARAAGFLALILTAKHHDGFCLWPTKTTAHSVAKSPWRGGRGDVVREFVDACRAEGLGAGLYLSPWDRNHPAYGDSPRYNDVYADQLTELLTQYGRLNEVWFDGANGEGPNGKRQVYDWPRTFGLVKKLQPNAVVFSDAGPDVRWCGNENGTAGEPNWSTVDPARVPAPGVSGPGVIAALQHGDRDGAVWRPAEADTSIRPGWFHHPAEDAQVKSAERLFDIYCESVGRNSKLLLNVPPTRDGALHPNDVASLMAFRDLRAARFTEVGARRGRASWTIAGAGRQLDVQFTTPVQIAAVRLEEGIEHGQSVARFSVHGEGSTGWRELARGMTIGYARIERFTPVAVSAIRLVVEEAIAPVQMPTIRAFAPR